MRWIRSVIKKLWIEGYEFDVPNIGNFFYIPKKNTVRLYITPEGMDRIFIGEVDNKTFNKIIRETSRLEDNIALRNYIIDSLVHV